MPLEFAGLLISMVFAIVTIWIAVAYNTNKINTTIELAIQILNNQQPVLNQIYDDSRGTHSTVKSSHDRIVRIETVQACQGQEIDSQLSNIRDLKRICDDMPAKIKALIV